MDEVDLVVGAATTAATTRAAVTRARAKSRTGNDMGMVAVDEVYNGIDVSIESDESIDARDNHAARVSRISSIPPSRLRRTFRGGWNEPAARRASQDMNLPKAGIAETWHGIDGVAVDLFGEWGDDGGRCTEGGPVNQSTGCIQHVLRDMGPTTWSHLEQQKNKSPDAYQKRKRERGNSSDDKAAGKLRPRKLKTAVREAATVEKPSDNKAVVPSQLKTDISGAANEAIGPISAMLSQSDTRVTSEDSSRGIVRIRKPERRTTSACDADQRNRRKRRETADGLSSGGTVSGGEIGSA
ncbi:hypothetical protein GQ600_20403 [Phytophthora cactorum]|nr:hypothetical protein GQ600_20403 [Phytophthora cactorum]